VKSRSNWKPGQRSKAIRERINPKTKARWMNGNQDENLPALEEVAMSASIYRELAERELMLDPTVPVQRTEITEVDRLSNLMRRAMQMMPHHLLVDRRQLTVHFIFPNLTDEERAFILDLSRLVLSIRLSEGNGNDPKCPDERRREHLDRAAKDRAEHNEKKMALDFESKLTAVQLEVLESSLCNPDAQDDLEWD
jgi:hypothetical protein